MWEGEYAFMVLWEYSIITQRLDNYATWVEEDPIIIESALARDVLNLSSP